MSIVLCKVVINPQFGGFALSDAAILWMAANGGLPLMIDEGYKPHYIESGRYLFLADSFRSMRLLVNCVETLGDAASGPHGRKGWTDALLQVYSWDARYGLEFKIEEHDGMETVTHPWKTSPWLQSPVWEVK